MKFHKLFNIFIIVLTCTFLFTACQTKSGQKKDVHEKLPAELPTELTTNEGKAVAIVNGTNIYQKELDRAFKAYAGKMVNMKNKLSPEQEQKIQKIILKELVETELLYQKSQDLGIKITDEEISSRIDQIKNQFPSEEQFQAQLAKFQIAFEDFKKDIKRNLFISKLIQEQASSQMPAKEISDEKLKQYYDGHKTQFIQDKMVKASHILVKVDKNADEAIKKKAEEKITEIQKKIKAGEDFAKLAEENSDCPSSKKGGDLGFFNSKQMVPEFSKAAFDLKPGEISDIVETPFGFHLIKVTDIKPSSEKSFEESKEIIKQKLSKSGQVDIIKDYIASLSKEADIKILIPEVASEHP